jgi:hypothetical protein
VIPQHSDFPDAHGARCFCGRRARWHVEAGVQGCGNFCGIHARVIQRRSLWSAVFNDPLIMKENRMDLTPEKKRALGALADQLAEELAERYGRARVPSPEYSAADLARGGWSVRVVGMSDDIEREAVRVWLDGERAAETLR